ncbi:MAG: hypothetical protein IJP31_11930 [Lachnospiraceae bacterium]|nr:hypothetical protein [Lachnospiraceae bacterium]
MNNTYENNIDQTTATDQTPDAKTKHHLIYIPAIILQLIILLLIFPLFPHFYNKDSILNICWTSAGVLFLACILPCISASVSGIYHTVKSEEKSVSLILLGIMNLLVYSLVLILLFVISS